MRQKYVGIREVAEHFNVHKLTVRNWMKRGIVPYVQIGDVIRLDLEEVLEALEKYRKNVGKAPVVPKVEVNPIDEDI